MKLSALYEDGHFAIIPDYPGSLVPKKSKRKRRKLNSVPDIPSWQKDYDRKTRTKQIKL